MSPSERREESDEQRAHHADDELHQRINGPLPPLSLADPNTGARALSRHEREALEKQS